MNSSSPVVVCALPRWREVRCSCVIFLVLIDMRCSPVFFCRDARAIIIIQRRQRARSAVITDVMTVAIGVLLALT